jgi:precorrin-3B synthase
MELTSRGNVQIRGIRDEEAAAGLADAVASAGLLPSPTHERVRNIVASPLSGRLGGIADVRDWVRMLDAAICAEPTFADLPGRFWFTLDDGRGDVSGLGADVGAHALGDSVALLLAGRDTGVRIAPSDVVATLLSIARRFIEIRESAWRVAELADASALTQGLALSAEPGRVWPAAMRPPVGWLVQDDGRIALAGAAPLGVLQARVAEYLAAIDAPIVVTPWRSVLVCDIDEGVADTALRLLAPMGLVFDDGSPWLDVSACTGSPGCEHSAADVRADAARAIKDDASVHRHFVGCERACGSPPDGDVLIATADGYVLRTASP